MNATAPVYHVRNGVTYRVKSVKTFKFQVWFVDGKWVELDGRNQHRTRANYTRLQVPSVQVETVASVLVANGKRSYLTCTTVRGEYADVSEYMGELANVRGVASFRNRSGMQAITLL